MTDVCSFDFLFICITIEDADSEFVTHKYSLLFAGIFVMGCLSIPNYYSPLIKESLKR